MATSDPALFCAAPDELAGRNILVTGAGDGIGSAAACSFAAHGATVILLGRTLHKLEQVHDRIVEAGHPTPILQPCDLFRATDDDYRTMAEAVEDQLGCLHGLLHNAGLLGPRTPLENYPSAAWQELMQVNVNAAFMLSKAMIPVLRGAGDASIVFTSSGVGRRARAYWGAYAVSKFAIEGMAQLLADELGSSSGIRVNCINPGATDTRMRREAYPAEDPAGNPRPGQIMASYLYLMSPRSIGFNGHSFDARAR